MRNRVDLQPAYVLHTQAYQNTSLLVDFFCVDYGRVRAVAKGARRAGSRSRSFLQPFQPLLISLSGRSDLKNLLAVEGSVSGLTLQGVRLFSGLYINELLVRLLMPQEGIPELYRSYQQAIIALCGEAELAPVLRRFELSLLEALGYGVDLQHDCYSAEALDADAHYLFHPDIGFERVPPPVSTQTNPAVFCGHELLALHRGDLADKAVSQAALRLTRMALQVHLGDKPLASRSLFTRPSQDK
ncbi:MAG: DNA repair protein RecO [Pseudomonadales bacterium]|nr:DNA repair protein RecO [Pseudomonadales bacterium]MCP5331140.1 DNA repair protein RecO [Pseudomonadales bacterium]MCP5343603.1 DNA repair protein RecO [Pseudomonadales bacterium]